MDNTGWAKPFRTSREEEERKAAAAQAGAGQLPAVQTGGAGGAANIRDIYRFLSPTVRSQVESDYNNANRLYGNVNPFSADSRAWDEARQGMDQNAWWYQPPEVRGTDGASLASVMSQMQPARGPNGSIGTVGSYQDYIPVTDSLTQRGNSAYSIHPTEAYKDAIYDPKYGLLLNGKYITPYEKQHGMTPEQMGAIAMAAFGGMAMAPAAYGGGAGAIGTSTTLADMAAAGTLGTGAAGAAGGAVAGGGGWGGAGGAGGAGAAATEGATGLASLPGAGTWAQTAVPAVGSGAGSWTLPASLAGIDGATAAGGLTLADTIGSGMQNLPVDVGDGLTTVTPKGGFDGTPDKTFLQRVREIYDTGNKINKGVNASQNLTSGRGSQNRNPMVNASLATLAALVANGGGSPNYTDQGGQPAGPAPALRVHTGVPFGMDQWRSNNFDPAALGAALWK